MAPLSLDEFASLLPAGAADVDLIARLLRALGDPIRLRLLEYLLTGEHTVTECVSQVPVSQGRVSTHLACLAGCGYVAVRREGRFAYYRVIDARVADLVRLAGALAADTAVTGPPCAQVDSGEPVSRGQPR